VTESVGNYPSPILSGVNPMKRAHDEANRTKREHVRHLRMSHGWPMKKVTCPCDIQAGRFRKMDAFDCGRPKCRICHWDKFLHNGKHVPTRKEKLAELTTREQLGEV
jgi:hypothetical protein